MRIVCISDTHLAHLPPTRIDVPDGDILVHAGDATFRGNKSELEEFAEWFGALPHKHKVFVPGNHDCGFEDDLQIALDAMPPCHILMGHAHRTVEIEGLKFWGSPYQPEFCNWAFNVPRGPLLRKHWATIPDDIDVLVTHSPPMGVLDRVWRIGTATAGTDHQTRLYTPGAQPKKHRRWREHVGCADMWQAVQRVRPRLHVFGHIHCDAGVLSHVWPLTAAEAAGEVHGRRKTTFVNAAICDDRYLPVHAPVVIDL
jgi:Icc-related predicted phosphoesterase